ncbi:MAG: TIGR01777 family protein [Lewinellaceae bacterium]|nr:TIGR01777 family protein [Lewinellaceae bacterium]
MSVILLAGGTGLIGRRLTELLSEQDDEVRVLTRSPREKGQFAWDPAAGAYDPAAFEGVDQVINLAGAGIADKRWTAARKRVIVESRVQSARTLRDAFTSTGHFPKAYISASAIGFYGNSGERPMEEKDAPVDDSFMVRCCQAWEAAADEVAALGIRTVKLRIGIVLSAEGGALAEFAKPMRFGIGGYFGDGKAWYSWIHLEDVCRMFVWAVKNEGVEGVFNAVSPNPVRNKEMVKSIAEAMHQPVLMAPGPAFAMRLLLGEMAAVVLNSNRVSPEKALKAGFAFRYPHLTEALTAIFA